MKNKILNIEVAIALITVLAIIFLEYSKEVLLWKNLWVNAAGNILIAVASGVSIGIIFELFVRKAQRDETFSIAKLGKELEQAGIEKYEPEFKDFGKELKQLLKKSLKIDMYLTYGGTFFNQISPDLSDVFKRKHCEINIFILSEKNPFLASLASLWSQIGNEYNEDGLKRKIQESTNLLLRLASTAYQSNIHAEVKIFKLLKSPINFSFYRFDDILVFCPTKLTERKEYRAPTLICRKSNQNDIFNWVMDELSHIKSSGNNFIQKIFPEQGN